MDTYQKEASEKALWYESIFGKGNFYLEFQYHGLESEKASFPYLERIVKATGIPPVASNDVHFAHNTEADERGRWLARSMRFNKAASKDPTDRNYYVRSDVELFEALTEIISPETAAAAISNIRSVIDACNVVMPTATHFPAFNAGDKSAHEYLTEMARNGIKSRYPGNAWTQAHENRLEYELSVIKDLGYSDYLCIVQDFLQEGRRLGKSDDVGMGVGPGRGSAAGSLVCYLAGITDIDPIRFGLLFERFLNKDRVSYPDIDSDFAKGVREKVIRFCADKYGDQGVVGIITYGTLAAKNAIRSAGRIRADEKGENPKEYSKVADALCACILQPDMTLDQADFTKVYDMHPVAKLIVQDAKLLEGAVVQYGMHAAGIIIADNGDASEYVPLAYNDGRFVTQYAAPDDEKMAGLLKMDFLGLETLDIITETLQNIRMNRNVTLDMSNVCKTLLDGRNTPFDVSGKGNVFDEVFSKGNTTGVFQFESPGMRQLLRKFAPKNISDIALLNACFRPGPISNIDNLCATHASGKLPKQIVDGLNDVLSDSYGYPVYQESVMRICNKICGMTLGESDMIRWAMAKKHKDVLAKYADKFITGMINAGASEADAKAYWDSLQSFGSYAFNKSHAVAYAYVAFDTAWLKLNYPTEFFTALLNHSENAKLASLLSEAREYGIKILPPDINLSREKFTCYGNSIRFGFDSVVGGSTVGDAIMKERQEYKFDGIEEFLIRCSHTSDKAVSALIYAGAFDSFHNNRSAMVNMIEPLRQALKDYLKAKKSYDDFLSSLDLEHATDKQKDKLDQLKTKKDGYFDILADEKYDASMPAESPIKLAEYELEYLGVRLSWDPMTGYDMSKATSPINEIQLGNGIYCGMVNKLRIVQRKSDGKDMAFFTLTDRSGSVEVACYNYSDDMNLVEGAMIAVHGNVKDMLDKFTQEMKRSLILDSVEPLTLHSKELHVHYHDLFCFQKYRNMFDIFKGSDLKVRIFDDMMDEERFFKNHEDVFVTEDIIGLKLDGIEMHIVEN